MTKTLLSLILIINFWVSAAAASVDEVKVDSGKLKGTIAGDVVSFKGVPFAAPPTGDNRWRPPQPVKPWSGVRPATAYGPDLSFPPGFSLG